MFGLSSILRIFPALPDLTNFIQPYYRSTNDNQQLVRREGYPPSGGEGGGWGNNNGWGSGGWGDGGMEGWKNQNQGWGDLNSIYYDKDGQTSPAISALTLLAFLFLLGVIQNSLNLNQQLLTTTVITTDGGAASAAQSTATSSSQSSSSSSSVSGTVDGQNFLVPPANPPFKRLGRDYNNPKKRIKRAANVTASYSRQNQTSPPDLQYVIGDVLKGFKIIGTIANYTFLDSGGKLGNDTLGNQTENIQMAQARDGSANHENGLYNSIRQFDILTKLRCLQMIASSCHVSRSSRKKRGLEVKKIIGAKIIDKVYSKLAFLKRLINAIVLKIQTKKLCFHIYKQCVLKSSVAAANHGWSGK